MDNNCLPVSDPSVSFDSHAYQSHESLFWSDLSRDPHWINAEFWSEYGVHMVLSSGRGFSLQVAGALNIVG
jgi:hypothetical protein